ncbi:hypothetical protein [Metabacillus niabensis]|nr:hypothetical protein [Metabacillus niabensis]
MSGAKWNEPVLMVNYLKKTECSQKLLSRTDVEANGKWKVV